MQPTFEFCAFRFWNQWRDEETSLYDAISAAPIAQDIRKALNYFQVARTFKGIGLDGNADYILDCLIRVRHDPTLTAPADKVETLAGEFKKKFGSHNISAASKLLWLSFRDPYVIYDGRAVLALSMQFGARFDGYRKYATAWRKAYTDNEGAIVKAVEELPKGRIFMRTDPPADQDILNIARETWFKERVFDIFLWEVGV